MSLFAYCYYRVNRVYFKREGRRGASSLTLLAGSQFFWIMDFCLFLIKCFSVPLVAFNTAAVKLSFVALILVLIGVNYKLYDGKYSKFLVRWSNETPFQTWSRGVLVFLFLILPLILLLLLVNW